jgi:hypothetical protein
MKVRNTMTDTVKPKKVPVPRKSKQTPPVNTALTRPTQGNSQIHDVVRLGLQNAVIWRKRRPRGYGAMTIADEINEKELKDSGVTISHMAVNRWWKDVYLKEHSDKEDIVNIYGSSVSLLNSMDKQLEVLENFIDNVNSEINTVDDIVALSKTHKELSTTFKDLSQRKQALLSQISLIQEKVYGFINVQRFSEIVMDTVAEQCDTKVYDAVVDKLRENKEYQELLRRIEAM